jgi:hypothetical protein
MCHSPGVTRVPTSLFVLLSALKKLITVDVPLDKLIIWKLIVKTIDREEFRSNFVYTVIQHLFEVVNVSCEEIYALLRRENQYIAPKLLMNVRRERKRKQLKAKMRISTQVCLVLSITSLLWSN